MNGSPGSPDDPPDPPSTDEDPDAPVRISFLKAPIVVLGGVVGLLLAILTAQVLFVEGEGSTVVTQPVGTSQDDDGVQPEHLPEPAPGANEEIASSGSPKGDPEPSAAPTADPSAEGTVSSSMDRMDDPGYVTARIAEGFAHDFKGVIDGTEARCMAEVVIGMFGIDRLWQITQAMADANADPGSFDRADPRFLSDGEANALNAQLRPCVSEEDARRLNLDS